MKSKQTNQLDLTKYRSNGRKRNRRAGISSITNALGAVPVVRNMMPKVQTVTKKIEFPLYLYLKTNKTLALSKTVSYGTEVDLPFEGMEWTNCPEYYNLSYEVDAMKLQALGATVNFVQNENITLVNVFEKWMYGDDPQRENCEIDSTYQPLEWDNKARQKYKTYLPKETAGYDTYYPYQGFVTDALRMLNYNIFAETPTAPTANTLVGTITLEMWLICKMKQHPVLNNAIKEKDQIIEQKDKQIEELNRKIALLFSKD